MSDLVRISPPTNCIKRSCFQTQSCCPATPTQLRQSGRYLVQKAFKLSSHLFGGRPLLRTGCCGKCSCQFSKRHHLTTCFGQPCGPATFVANEYHWFANRCFHFLTFWLCKAGRANSFIRIIVFPQGSSCTRTHPTSMRRCIANDFPASKNWSICCVPSRIRY